MYEHGGIQVVESVTNGHPDKFCDRVSDAILDAALAGDPNSRVAIETAAKSGVRVLGEMTTSTPIDIKAIVRRVWNETGYRPEDLRGVDVDVVRQSPDIALINKGAGAQGAGDQGIMNGFAVWNPAHEHMPTCTAFARKLTNRLHEVRASGALPWMGPDGKSQVVMRGGAVTHVTIAIQHDREAPLEDIRREVFAQVIVPVVGDIDPKACTINGTGAFILGGPAADAGLTGRKIVVDQYGPGIPVGGGAFSGKDPTKVDRTAAYMARFIAKEIVRRQDANEAFVQLAYTINGVEPDALVVIADGRLDAALEAWVRKTFPLSPAGMIEFLGLTHPQGWSYEDAAAFGHFGRPQFPWEQARG